MNFRYASYLILVALPFYGIRFSFFGQPTHALEVLVVAILAMYFLRHPEQRRRITDALMFRFAQHDNMWEKTGIMLLLAATISLFVSPNFSLAFASYRQYYIEPMLFFIMLSREFHGIADVNKLLLAISIPTVPIALVAFAQHFNFYPIPGAYLADHRATSLYSYANAVGLYLAPIIAALVAFALSSCHSRSSAELSGIQRSTTGSRIKSGMTTWAGIILLIILLVTTIFFSQTEAALLALIATALIAGFSSPRFRRATLGVIVIGMLILALHLPLAETVIGKLTLQDFSGAVRRTIWSETVGMLKDHWLLGAGLAGYQTVMIPYHFQKDIEIFWYPHTLLLNFWVELGLLGLVALLRVSYIVYRQLRSIPAAHCWIVIAPLLVMLIHGLFDVPFFKPDLALLTATFLAFILILTPRKVRTVPLGFGDSP